MKNIFYLLKIFPKLPFRYRFFKYLEKFSSLSQGKGWGFGTIPEEVKASISFFKMKPKIFIDIGANKGLYTSFLLNKINNIECHLFEPSEDSYLSLKSMFSDYVQIKINKIGLSNTNSKAKLFSDRSGSPLSSLTKRRLDHFNIDMNIEEEVEIKRFDEYWKSDGRIIDFVKIDVEGHELKVLEGFGDLLNITKLIQFEFGGCNIDTRTYFQDFWYFFKNKGFSLYRITPTGVLKIRKYIEQDETFNTTNYIALNNKLI